MGGLGLPRQPAHQQTTPANQTMRDVVAVSPDLLGSVSAGARGAERAAQELRMVRKHADSPLGRRQHGYC